MPRGTQVLPIRATVPRPLHTAALGAPGERRGAAVQLGERVAKKGALPGSGCLIPRMGGGCPPSHNFRGRFPPVFFSCPQFGVSICMEGFFPGMEHYQSPGIQYHLYFRSEVERPTL